ncbi:Protein RER1B [Porphyridium purpureum]|uniref:Protein RER1B n=1 Tax=Porphyridium purpureum TaxID=35688 RepID=A0A5J4YVP6_PORPP|nr:Protein RER1B [Porphyridium purpureum]|eukprot:POR0394..scf209_3
MDGVSNVPAITSERCIKQKTMGDVDGRGAEFSPPPQAPIAGAADSVPPLRAPMAESVSNGTLRHTAQPPPYAPPRGLGVAVPRVPAPAVSIAAPDAAMAPGLGTGPATGGMDFSGRQGSFMDQASRRYSVFLDQITPLILYRWLAFVVVLLSFALRMFMIHGFYIVAYVLFIFLLNQFILFLQPKDRSALGDNSAADSDEPGLPTTSVVDFDTYRPFYRRLPEFKFWHSATRATLLAIVCTFVPFLDVPVFWPILVVYSVVLFFATMRKQLADMKRFKYVPWDIGKKQKYSGTSKSVASTETAGGSRPSASGAGAKRDGGRPPKAGKSDS